MTIEEQLDRLAEMRAAADLARIAWEQKRDEILAPVKAELAALDAEFEPLLADVSTKIADTEATVKAAVLTEGHTVKGGRLMAVWAKGRISWNTSKLEGLMIALPALKECRSEGQPSVSIRTV